MQRSPVLWWTAGPVPACSLRLREDIISGHCLARGSRQSLGHWGRRLPRQRAGVQRRLSERPGRQHGPGELLASTCRGQ